MALAAAAVVGIAVVQMGSGAGSTTTGTLASASAATTAPVTSAPVTNAVFADDFSAPSLDPAKWHPTDRPDVITQVDGHLNFSVRPGAVIDTSLQPITLPRAFEELTFDMVVPQYGKAGNGGAVLIINPLSAQPQQLTFGPSPGGPTVYPLICEKPKCTLGNYEDFTDLSGPPTTKVQVGQVVVLRVVRQNGHLDFFAHDVLIGQTKSDPGPLTDFRFGVSAESTESWDIQVDNVIAH